MQLLQCKAFNFLNVFKSRFLFILLFASFSGGAIGSTFYWVGGTGNWSDHANHWATTSGGAAFQTHVPTSVDDVIFDANSFTGTGQVVTLDTGNFSCRNMDWTAANFTPMLYGDMSDYFRILKIYGSLYASNKVNWNHRAYTYFESTSTGNFISPAKIGYMGVLEFMGVGGEWTLLDSIPNANAIWIYNGTLNTNNKNITLYSGSFKAFAGYTSLYLGSSVIKGDAEVNIAVPAGIFDASNSTLIAAQVTLPAGKTYCNITATTALNLGANCTIKSIEINNSSGTCYMSNYSGSVISKFLAKGDISISGPATYRYIELRGNSSFGSPNTFDTLNLNNASKTVTFPVNYPQTITKTIITPAAICTNGWVTIKSNATGSKATISKSSGTLICTNLILQNLNATGGASFIANNSSILANVTGWTVNTPVTKNYYWIGGTGNWTDGAHWSLASGGSAASCVPTPFDNAIFDNNSFSAYGQSVTINGTSATCSDLTCTGVLNWPTISGVVGAEIRIYRNLTMSSNMNWSFKGAVNLNSSSNNTTIKSNGLSLASSSALNFVGTGNWYLLDSISANTINLYTGGTFTTNHNVVRCITNFATVGTVSTIKTCFLGHSMIICDNFYPTNVTKADSATIYCQRVPDGSYNSIHKVIINYVPEADYGIMPGTYTQNCHFDTVIYNTSSYMSSWGNNSFNYALFNSDGIIFSAGNSFKKLECKKNLDVKGPTTYDTLFLNCPGYSALFSGSQTITRRFLTGGSCLQGYVTIETDTSADNGQANFVKTTVGNVTCDFVILKNLQASGSVTWTAVNSINGGGVTGWTFTGAPQRNLYWVGGSGNWNDMSHWSLSSGGPGGECHPTSSDNVTFDNNSFPSGGSLAINIATPMCRDMNWVQTTGSPAIENTYTQVTTQPGNLYIYGSLNLSVNTTWNYNGNLRFSGSKRGNSINTKGKVLADIYFQGAGADWTLQDSIACGNLILNSGKLNTNNKLWRCSQNFFAAGDTLQLGSSKIYCSEWHNFIDSTTSSRYKFSSGTSTIFGTVAFSGQHQKYFKVDMRGPLQNNFTAQSCGFDCAYFSVVNFQNCSGITFNDARFEGFADLRGNTTFKKATFVDNANLYDNNLFDTLVLDNPGKTIACAAGKTQAVNKSFIINSTFNDFIGLMSITQGSQTFFSSPIDTLCFNYLSLRDINVTGGTVCNAGLYSANFGNNSGCTFTNCELQTSDVWPGNSNQDYEVNNNDLLNIGVAYGHTDVSRIGASLVWTAQPCKDWNAIFADFLNVKNADCDGNGLVDSLDLHALLTNYGNSLPNARLASPRGGHLNNSRQGAIGTDLYFSPVLPSYNAGAWVSIPINLGTAASSLQNAYGTSFKINYDSIYVVNESMSVTYGGSWLVKGGNKINMEKSFPVNSQIDVAFSRISHIDTSGNGEIALLTFKIKNNVNGVLHISFSDCNGIKSDGSIIDINPISADLNIGNSSTVALSSLSIQNMCSGTSSTLNLLTGGSFNSGNAFSVQLSDGTGNFSAPVTIGSVTSTTSGSVNFTIPSTATSESHYRIRLISSDPYVISSPSNDFSISNILSSPGTISGPPNVCSYKGTSQNAGYSIPNSEGATVYNWTVPAGVTIVSGQGTTNLNVIVASSFSSGNITVTSGNSCGNSPTSAILIRTTPSVPGTISGPTNVCAYTGISTNQVSYSVPVVAGATSYTWTVPANATIYSGQGTNAISVAFASAFSTGNITVKGVNACGTSTASSFAVSKTVPAVPGAISGATNICQYSGTFTGVVYTINPVANADAYNWSLPAGVTIVSGQGTSSISVYFSHAFASGNISVQSVSNCGNSAARTLAIVSSPPVPGTISGPTNACGYVGYSNTATYSVAPVPGNTGYIWTVPAGVTITSGSGTTSISVLYSNSFTSGSITVKSVADCGTSATKTLTITKTAPATPGTITGPTNACQYMGGATNAIYSVGSVSGAAAYTWTVPTGASIVSGQGTNTITVSYSLGFVSGNISVQSISTCGNSAAKTLAISQTAPAIPGTISGPANACFYMGNSTNATYSITTVANASSYNWTVPAGATIVTGQGTNTITVSYSTSFVSGNVGVQAVAGCGSSALRALTITKTAPATPGTISGITNVCPYIGSSTNVTYSIASITNASSYNWVMPANAVIISGQGTTSVTVNFSSAFTSGNISVQSVAGCGSSAAKTLAITKTIPATPGTISGPTNVCSYMSTATTATYTIAAVSGASSYNWTVPSGASIASGQGTTSIDVSYTGSFTSGNISVQSVANCGSSTAKTLAISSTLPSAPGAISGPTNACTYVGSATNAVYTISAVSGATTYNWNVPANTSIVSGQGTTSLTISYSSSFSGGTLSVQSVSGCGSSPSSTLAITNSLPATPSTIAGPTDACAYVSSGGTAAYSIPSVAGATSYNWSLPTGVTLVSGQGTTTIVVSYLNSFVSGTISVQSVVSCGSSAPSSLTVSNSLPLPPTSISGPTDACPYIGSSQNVSYSISAVAGATSYNWSVPSGATVISGQGTTTITVSYSGSFTSGNITVQSVVSCGSSAVTSLVISNSLPQAPGTITGPVDACSYISGSNNAVYSIAAVSGATSYLWIVPSGASIVSGQGSTSIVVNFSSSFSSENISAQAVAGCGNSAASVLAVTNSLPLPPTSIAGATDACPFIAASSVATYSINPVDGASSYNWTVPSGATIASGQGTTGITVNYNTGFSVGNISVSSVANCGSSTVTSLAITNSYPATPIVINGPSIICSTSLSNIVYTTPAAANATSYTWSVASGISIISGQGTNTLTITYSSTFVSGTISVSAKNSCSSSTSTSMSVTKTSAPGTPGIISGPFANVCASVGSYSIALVSRATSYTWTVPTGVTISSGQSTNSISVAYGSTFVSGTVSVKASNACGVSAAKTLVISKRSAAPATLTGLVTNACTYTTTIATYTAAAVTGAISYTWILPTGATLVSGQGTNTVSVNFASTFSTGVISVIANNSCASSIAKTITVSGAPAIPGVISGPSSNICDSTGTYSVALVNGATSYTWTVPSGVIISSGQGTNAINVIFGNSFISGLVSVKASNGCSISSSKTRSISKRPAAPATLTGPLTNACTYTAAFATYSAAAVAGAISYSWTLPAGATLVSGQGTNTITVNFASTFSTGVISVFANNTCSTSPPRTITVSGAPAVPGTIGGLSSNVCATTGTYSVAAVSGATSYAWTVPAGVTISSGQGTNSINVIFDNTFFAGSVSVQASNGCSTSAAKALAISKRPPTPVSISGPTTNACTYSSAVATYSTPAVSGAVSYAWTVPADATLISGQGTNTITVNFASTYSTGVITVVANNSCTTSVAKSITVSGIPATPSVISGPASNLCGTTATYSVASVSGASSYNWIITGGTLLSGQGTNTITVSFGNSVASGSIKVAAANGCSSSAYRSLTLVNCSISSQRIIGEQSFADFSISEIYPNPANSAFWFEVESINQTQCIVEIIDLSGRIIQQSLENINSGKSLVETKLTTESKGVYLVRIINKETGSAVTRKITVQ
jgi:large repetitive protein